LFVNDIFQSFIYIWISYLQGVTILPKYNLILFAKLFLNCQVTSNTYMFFLYLVSSNQCWCSPWSVRDL